MQPLCTYKPQQPLSECRVRCQASETDGTSVCLMKEGVEAELRRRRNNAYNDVQRGGLSYGTRRLRYRNAPMHHEGQK